MRLGLGCMALTGLFGHVHRRSAIRTIHHALEIGVRHFDTAELYGPYVNEEILAEALASQLDRPVVATKVGYKLVEGKIVGLDSRPASLRAAVEGSLRRLRRDRIDLVYQHRQDPAVPVEEAIGELARLQAEGKIGGIGLSAIDSATFARAKVVTAIAAVQNEYSLLHREPECNLLATMTGSQTTFVAYSPLARGLLAGTARSWPQQAPGDYRRSDERFAPDRLVAITDAAAVLHAIAANRQVAASVVALSWLLNRSRNVAVIPGCKSPAQVSLAKEAVQFELSAEERVRLEAMWFS
ncbi:MAG: aldo/keto reductase [Rhodopila sp.]|nr:aldo/keto reductase [Rhodopila sp.]